MIRKNVEEVLNDRVVLDLGGIHPMYLNAYVPSLPTGVGFAHFLRSQLDRRIPSTFMIAISKELVAAIERFVKVQGVDLVSFAKGQRKDEVAQQHLVRFEGDEDILFVSKAEEKARCHVWVEDRAFSRGPSCSSLCQNRNRWPGHKHHHRFWVGKLGKKGRAIWPGLIPAWKEIPQNIKQ